MRISTSIPLLVFAALAYGPSQGLADPILGSDLATFAVLGSSTVTNVPTSAIDGNVGVWSSGGANAITGFNSSPGVPVSDLQVTGGNVHAGTASGTPNAMSAQGQLTTARTTILGSLGSGTLLPADLTGLTIFPGVFTVPFGAINLSGAVTLNGLGDPNAFWLFQTGALTTASASVVNVINTGAGAGVFWNDTSSVTLNTTTSFQGNILALTSIFLRTGATIGCGRALANTAEVTMDTNTIGIGCGPGTGGVAGSIGFSGSNLEFTGGHVVIARGENADTIVSVPGTFVRGTSVPEPATLALLGIAVAGMGLARRRKLS